MSTKREDTKWRNINVSKSVYLDWYKKNQILIDFEGFWSIVDVVETSLTSVIFVFKDSVDIYLKWTKWSEVLGLFIYINEYEYILIELINI